MKFCFYTQNNPMASFTENVVTGRRKDGSRYVKGTYIEFVESYRVPGKKYPRRRILWRKNKQELEKAGWFDRMLLWFAARTNQTKVVSLEEPFVKKVAEWAVPEAVRRLLDEAGILERIRQLDEKGRHRYSLEDVVVGYVTMSFLEQCSKLRYYNQGQEKVFGYKPNELHQIYRAVRKLADVQWLTLEELQERWNIFKPPVEVMLFDFTTVYWESEEADSLRQRGWSKDGKADKVQVLVAMVVDDRGLPVAMEVFEGARSEKVAVKEFIKQLSDRVDIRDIVFVGDAGLYSKAFLDQLRSLGWKVLLRMPRNRLSKEEKEQILAPEGWKVMEADKASGEVLKEVKEIEGRDSHRLIAVRDARLRARQLHELDELLDQLGLRNEDGTLKQEVARNKDIEEKLSSLARRYTRGIVHLTGQKIRVDEERIEELRQWAGISVFITDVSWSKERVVKRYGMLRRIEAKWRDLKSGLHVRPVYHRNETAVRGHFVLKFFALQVASLLEHKLREAGLDMTWREAIDMLREVKATQIEFADGTMGWVRTDAVDRQTLEVMRILGIPTERVLLSSE